MPWRILSERRRVISLWLVAVSQWVGEVDLEWAKRGNTQVGQVEVTKVQPYHDRFGESPANNIGRHGHGPRTMTRSRFPVFCIDRCVEIGQRKLGFLPISGGSPSSRIADLQICNHYDAFRRFSHAVHFFIQRPYPSTNPDGSLCRAPNFLRQ
jgi:hypothetical protein